MKNQKDTLSVQSQISHELRTPMSGILGFLQFLSDTQIDDEQRDYLSHIEASANRLLDAQGKIDHLLSDLIAQAGC